MPSLLSESALWSSDCSLCLATARRRLHSACSRSWLVLQVTTKCSILTLSCCLCLCLSVCLSCFAFPSGRRAVARRGPRPAARGRPSSTRYPQRSRSPRDGQSIDRPVGRCDCSESCFVCDRRDADGGGTVTAEGQDSGGRPRASPARMALRRVLDTAPSFKVSRCWREREATCGFPFSIRFSSKVSILLNFYRRYESYDAGIYVTSFTMKLHQDIHCAGATSRALHMLFPALCFVTSFGDRGFGLGKPFWEAKIGFLAQLLVAQDSRE